MANRYQSFSFTTSSVASAAVLQASQVLGPHCYNLVKLKIVRNTGAGNINFRIFKKGVWGSANRLIRFENQTVPLVQPVDKTSGPPGVEALEGTPLPIDDEDGTNNDGTGKLHYELENLGTTSTFTISGEYEEVVVLSGAGDPSWRGAISALTSLTLRGSASGAAVISAPAAAGSPTLTLPTSSGTFARLEDKLSVFAATTSAELAGVISDETGSGALVFANTPTLVTPLLGTPTSGTLTNCTGLPISTGVSGLASGIATFLGTPSSANLAAAITNETGSGALVFATSPALVTPTLGVATATSIAIGANTLDTSEWANLDGINQTLATTSTPQFTRLGLGAAAHATALLNLNSALIYGDGSGNIGFNVAAAGAQIRFGGSTTANNGIYQDVSISPGAGVQCNVFYCVGLITEASSGNHSLLTGLRVDAPVITGGAATVTDTATVYITSAPIATVTGANRALWVNTGTVRFGQYGAGTATFDANGVISSVSDERLKIIDRPFWYGLKELRALSPVLYRWSEESGLDTEGLYPGFSAQQVQKVMPEAVGIQPDGYLTLQDRGLIALAVNAIKELDRRMSAMETR